MMTTGSELLISVVSGICIVVILVNLVQFSNQTRKKNNIEK